MTNRQLLKELCALNGVSGREGKVRQYILDTLSSYKNPMEIRVDAMGNILVHLIGENQPCKVLQLDAHMDEVGVIITHIRPDGMLGFETVGGIDPQALFGHCLRFDNCQGIIGGKAVHQCNDSERKKLPTVEDMYIDIGADNDTEAGRLVSVGDCGTFVGSWSDMKNDFFLSKAVDDRVGCAILLELAGRQPKYDFWITFTVQEEIGLRGAQTAAEAIRPDIAVVLDATTAADVAGNSEEQSVCFAGSGAVLSFMDKATLYDEALYRDIRQLAKANSIQTQTKNRIAGGNNAGAIQRAHTGVRIAAVSLPCRYIHSASCVGNWKDVESMSRLIELLAEELPV